MIDKDIVETMTLMLRDHAGDVFKTHHQDSNKPPVKELVKALMDVGAAMATTFGCPKANFIKMAMDAYDNGESTKTLSLSTTVGGFSNVNEKKVLN